MINSKLKMIASDLDGTLLGLQGTLSKLTRDTLLDLQKQGIKVAVCTGRPFHSSENVVKELQLKEFGGAFIGLNGQFIHDYASNTIIQKETLDPSDLQYIFDFAVNHGIPSMEIYDDEFIYLVFPRKSKLSSFFVSLLYGLRSLIQQSKNYNIKIQKKLPQKSVAKVCFLGEPKKLSQFAEAISLNPSYTCFFVHDFWLEILKSGINKGAALQELADLSNISLQEIVAFGDGENDCSLLETAGLSFAVSNAMENTKKSATGIIGSNQQDAVAAKCLELFKNEKM